MSDRSHTTEELDSVGSRYIEGQRGRPVGEPKVELTDSRSGKAIVRWFLSYARRDEDEMLDFYSELEMQLSLSSKYAFEGWSDNKLLIGERWHEEIQAALQSSHLGILLVSPGLLASQYIEHWELPAFFNGEGSGVEGKRVLPLQLKRVASATNLKGLGSRQIFRGKVGKAYTQLERHQRGDWVAELVEQIESLLDKYALRPAVRSNEPKGSHTRGHLQTRAADMLSRDLDGVEHLVWDAKGLRTSLNAHSLLSRSAPTGEGEVALDYLMAWVRDNQSPPIFALLGEYGMGKTITCQRLVRELESAREREPELPQPLYFDLRNLSVRNRSTLPTIDEILEECMSRGWQLQVQRPSAKELIERAEREALLFVFDGLDEALVHLSETDGTLFTRELFRLRPLRSQAHNSNHHTHGRILVSCRTHYFRTLDAQQRHFTGQERDARSEDDFRALVLLPFTEAQVRTYLTQAVSNLNIDEAIVLMSSVHNLTELSGRPFTLKLVAKYVPDLETLRSRGQPVHGVTLYRKLVQSWLGRDDGKHHLKPDHKRLLMAHLAAWLWQRREQVVQIGSLEAWFADWCRMPSNVQGRYDGVARDKLEEDLRTATFLIRTDGDEVTGAGAGFRFAHRSLHEYFLACHLFDAIVRGRRADWCLPKVSRETLDFLGQMLAESHNEDLVTTLEGWRTPYLAEASEQLFHYGIRALANGWPSPSLAEMDLQGVQLPDLRLTDHSERLDLSGIDLRGANLRNSVLHRVSLNGAQLDGALLNRNEWLDVEADAVSLVSADLTGTVFRGCRWAQSQWKGARCKGVHALYCDPIECADVKAVPVQADKRPTPLATPPPQLISRRAHSSWVRACAFTPDGNRAVSASDDCTLKLWDVVSGTCIATWQGHTRPVNACVIDHRGSRALSASDDHTLKLWDATSGRCVATWTAHDEPVHACAFSPDGSLAVSTSADRTLKLWDVASNRCIDTWRGHRGLVSACAFAPDGKHVVSASYDYTLKLWNVGTGKAVATWRGHEDYVLDCDFSPDSSKVVSGGDDRSLRLWDVSSGKCIASWLAHDRSVSACIFTPDGQEVVSASNDYTLKRWRVRSRQCTTVWTGHKSPVFACAFAPDGISLLSAGADSTLRLWNANDAGCIAIWDGQNVPIIACAFSPNGSRIASVGSDSRLRLWDAQSGSCITTWKIQGERVRDFAFTPDSSRLLTAEDLTLKLWDESHGKPIASWSGHRATVLSCAFSPDGTHFASTDASGMVTLWNAAAPSPVFSYRGHERESTACAFTSDGCSLVSASSDATLRVWDLAKRTCVTTLKGHNGWVRTCAFSPSKNQLVSGSEDGTLKLWNLSSGACVATWLGHGGPVFGCAFAPDGTRVISASSDSTLKLWDVSNGQCLATWPGHEGPVYSCAFSPNGDAIISSGHDGSIRIWNSASGKLLRLHQHEGESYAVFSPQNNLVIEADEGAWRWLGWQVIGEDGQLEDVLPAESFGPLPYSATAGTSGPKKLAQPD